MKKGLIVSFMAITAIGATSCGTQKGNGAQDDFKWIIDKFDDVKVLQYKVNGFDQLTLQQKTLIYYLNEAALCGRDILFDQNFKYNLPIRRTLEAIYINYNGHKETPQWHSFEKYLKKVWFANGIHHHYSNDKFIPEFGEEYFDTLIAAIPEDKLPLDFGTKEELLAAVKPAMFDPALYPTRLNQTAGQDLLLTSAMNYYDGVAQDEAEVYYACMAANNGKDMTESQKEAFYTGKLREYRAAKKAEQNWKGKAGDETPTQKFFRVLLEGQPEMHISYGLNSQLAKLDGKLVERTWKVGGMYSPAIERIIYWLDKARGVAEEPQKEILSSLINYYSTGDLQLFDEFNINWVQDTESIVDYINGFTETYGDPLSYKASWESIVNFKNVSATKRTELISDNAQWFEDNAPIQDKYKKDEVKGVSAKVITAAILGGDCYPATPIGVNLPNADWIRKEYGSKSVTIQNITEAYAESGKGSGFQEEFVLREEDRERMKLYGTLADNLHTDLHECLGHGSGQLAPGVSRDALKQYSSVMEEARADLFALYYLADKKLVQLGITPNQELYKAEYASYVMNGMMTQLARIELGKDVEQTHMRNRKLNGEWAYDLGKTDNVIEKTVIDGKTYIVINDFDKLRDIFGQMLREVQRIKSEGDFAAAQNLVEKYSVKIDYNLHKEVLDRYSALNIQPYSGFVNPVYTPVMENGQIVDVIYDYPGSYVEQMLDYSSSYSFLPSKN